MKKLFVLGFVCLLAVSVFGQEEFPGLQPEKPKENFAFITMVKGNVLVGKDQDQQEQARQGNYIFGDDWIVTEKRSQVEIRFGEQGGYLTIGENSKVFFVEVSPEKSIIAVSWGSVSSHQLEGVEIQTPTENPSLEKTDESVVNDYYSPYPHYWDYWRWYGMYFSWYPAWYYPMYYYGYYGYSGYYNYGQRYGDYYGRSNSNYGNSGRRIVDRNQLQVRPTRTTTIRQTVNYPSRISNASVRPSRVVNTRPTTSTRPTISNRSVRQSPSSFKPSSNSAPRIQQGPTSSYRTPQSSPRSQGATVSRSSSPSRGSSSSTGRSTSSGSVRRR